jgi:cell division septal protein FtsQ
MSREGRRRLVLGIVRIMAVSSVAALVLWGAWEVVRAVRENSHPSVVAKGQMVKDIRLITDGTLDRSWVLSALALPKNATLLGLDLKKLRDRILAHGQVIHATVEVEYPTTLVVRTKERFPVARVRIESEGGLKDLLVARDGVAFAGVGFDVAMTDALPWLKDVNVLPVAGMAMVSDLLTKSKLEAEHLYQTWHAVSLARLESDGVIEVQTKNDLRVRFATNQDFFLQLARLDWILDNAGRGTGQVPSRIDLTNHVQVAVVLAPPAPSPVKGEFATQVPTSAKPAVFPAFPNLSFPTTTKREF